MKLLLLLGFSLPLALESETSGAHCKRRRNDAGASELVLHPIPMLSQCGSTILVDLLRLVEPLKSTFKLVSIQSFLIQMVILVVHMIGSTRGNESPSRSFGWAIEGDIFENHNANTYPFLDNCQGIDYWQPYTTFAMGTNSGTVIPCSEPGTYWDCIQSNPYQRWMYLGAKVAQSTGKLKVAALTADLVGLNTLGVTHGFCTSMGKKYTVNPQYKYPLVQQQHEI